METTENLRERLEALENQAQAFAKQTRAAERRLHCWRRIAYGLLIVGLVSMPLASGITAQDESAEYRGIRKSLAALEYKLQYISGGPNEVVITGANLRIVNGLGVERTNVGTPITDLYFDINTKGDHKASEEPVNIQILKDDTAILYNSGLIGYRQLFPKNSRNKWKAPGPGHPIRFPILLDDCSRLKFRVEKAGDKPWEVSFRVRANNDQVVLVTDTPIVSFGTKNPIRVEKPLEGPGGIKAQHFNGGNFHVFGFTCHP